MALSFDEIWVYGGQLIVAKPLTTPKALGTGLNRLIGLHIFRGHFR